MSAQQQAEEQKDVEVTPEQQQRILSKLIEGRKRRVIPVLPIVHSKNKFAFYGLGFVAAIITLGNAIANAGMAFCHMIAYVGGALAGISGAGTFVAFNALYGESVFPEFQKMLTQPDEQEEFLALSEDLKRAENWGLNPQSAEFFNFLGQRINERRAARCRFALKKHWNELAESYNNEVVLQQDLKQTSRLIWAQVLDQDQRFIKLLSNYYRPEDSASQEQQKLYADAQTLFTKLYNNTVEGEEGPILPIPGYSSMYQLLVSLQSKLKGLEGINSEAVDLQSITTEVFIFHQWAIGRWRYSAHHTICVKAEPVADDEKAAFVNRESSLDYQWLNPEAKARVKKLKTLFSINLSEAEFYAQYIQEDLQRTQKFTFEKILSESTEADSLLSGEENTHSREEFIKYKERLEREENDRIIRGKWENRLGWLGNKIGFFGAVANGALGYLGIWGLVMALGLTSTPAAWVPILIIGIFSAFGSSNWMTRLRIEDRFRDVGRYFDKKLYVEHKYLRAVSMLIATGFGASCAYLAFGAGQSFIVAISVLFAGGATSLAVPVIALIFGMGCGIATFFGAGALGVQLFYEGLEPYVDVVLKHWNKGSQKYRAEKRRFPRLANFTACLNTLLRKAFFGKDEGEKVTWLDLLQYTLGRALGLVFLVGAVASQIVIGTSPLLLASLIISSIAMFALYSGVFKVAKQIVDAIFASAFWAAKNLVQRPLVWMYNNPIPVLAGLFAALSLELVATAAAALITKAAVVGISISMAVPVLITGLIVLFMAGCTMAYTYKAAPAGTGKGAEEDVPLIPVSGKGGKGQAVSSQNLQGPPVNSGDRTWRACFGLWNKDAVPEPQGDPANAPGAPAAVV